MDTPLFIIFAVVQFQSEKNDFLSGCKESCCANLGPLFKVKDLIQKLYAKTLAQLIMFWTTHPLMMTPLSVQLVPFVAPLSKMQYVQEGNYQTLGNKILTFLHISLHILWYLLCSCKMATKQLFICKVSMQQPITCGLGTEFFADLYTIIIAIFWSVH